MQKAEKINFEDTNVAGLGSDLDKKCRVDAAATEKAWAKAGKKPGLQIWRIEKLQVKASMTPPGTFYNADSYICLNTYKKKDQEGKELDKLCWDIHFWLGTDTSQDEAGTAAYKTVELDDFLGGEPVQHREVSGFESRLFMSYFDALGGVRLLDGGIESGFNHVKPEEFRPRLLHLKGAKTVRVVEVPLTYDSLNNNDVFILDAGMKIFQFQGKKAGKQERSRAGMLCRAIDDERKGKPDVFVYTQGDSDELEFFCNFPGYEEGKVPEISTEASDDASWEKDTTKKLLQLSDAEGKINFTDVTPASGKITRDLLKTDDVFIFDIGHEVIAWVGKGASEKENKSALQYAADYLKTSGKPVQMSVSKIFEGSENNTFRSAFD